MPLECHMTSRSRPDVNTDQYLPVAVIIESRAAHRSAGENAHSAGSGPDEGTASSRTLASRACNPAEVVDGSRCQPFLSLDYGELVSPDDRAGRNRSAGTGRGCCLGTGTGDPPEHGATRPSHESCPSYKYHPRRSTHVTSGKEAALNSPRRKELAVEAGVAKEADPWRWRWGRCELMPGYQVRQPVVAVITPFVRGEIRPRSSGWGSMSPGSGPTV
jgi:hypothetical protein